MSKVIFVRGYPGAGKSSFAKFILDKFPDKIKLIDPDAVIISDSIGDKLLAKKQKYRFNLNYCISVLNEGLDVIWTQSWRSISGLNITINNIKTLYSEDVAFLVVEVTQDKSTCWNNVRNKFLDFTEDTYYREYIDNYEKFNLKNIPFIEISYPFEENIITKVYN